MFVAYLNIFNNMGLRAIPMQADTGPIGGDLSHELLVLAETGESAVFCHKDILNLEVPGPEIDYGSNLQSTVDKWTSLYAATEEKIDTAKHAEIGSDLVSARGIEVGHIFYLGNKYSKEIGSNIFLEDGSSVSMEMGCYGIGVSRLIAAAVEQNHDDKGIIWPGAMTPFDVAIVPLGMDKSERVQAATEELYHACKGAGLSAFLDDRAERPGVKFAEVELLGMPVRVTIGDRSLAEGKLEITQRRTGETEMISPEQALDHIHRLLSA